MLGGLEAPPLEARGDLFPTLIRSILGQQISVKAATTVWERIRERTDITPEGLLSIPHDELQSCGLSHRKTEYVHGIAEAFSSGFEALDWAAMDDEGLIDKLTELRGVGRWTAEMLLIFSFLRPDIFPIDDLGVVRGIERHYNGGETLSKAELRAIAETWRPWRTAGSWLMWRSVSPG